MVHLIDHVLLPIDGDAELEPFQTRRLEAIKKRAEAARKKKAEADEEEDDEDSIGDVFQWNFDNFNRDNILYPEITCTRELPRNVVRFICMIHWKCTKVYGYL